MNAVMFSNLYSRAVKDFFHRCCKVETMEIRKMQEIILSIDNGYFTLYLETDDNNFSQEFTLSVDKIEALCFIC